MRFRSRRGIGRMMYGRTIKTSVDKIILPSIILPKLFVKSRSKVDSLRNAKWIEVRLEGTKAVTPWMSILIILLIIILPCGNRGRSRYSHKMVLRKVPGSGSVDV
jgi:hypothetical protein